MLKDIPAPLRPIIPIFTVVFVFVAVEFGFILIGEWQDENYWSFGIRLCGLALTVALGFWFKRAFKKVQDEIKKTVPNAVGIIHADDGPLSLPPTCKHVTEDAVDAFGMEIRCQDFSWRHGLCLRHWADSVENRLGPVDRLAGLTSPS